MTDDRCSAILEWAVKNKDAMTALLDGNAAVLPLSCYGHPLEDVRYGEYDSDAGALCTLSSVRLDHPTI